MQREWDFDKSPLVLSFNNNDGAGSFRPFILSIFYYLFLLFFLHLLPSLRF